MATETKIKIYSAIGVFLSHLIFALLSKALPSLVVVYAVFAIVTSLYVLYKVFEYYIKKWL